jgi:hypothetical protein
MCNVRRATCDMRRAMCVAVSPLQASVQRKDLKHLGPLVASTKSSRCIEALNLVNTQWMKPQTWKSKPLILKFY